MLVKESLYSRPAIGIILLIVTSAMIAVASPRNATQRLVGETVDRSFAGRTLRVVSTTAAPGSQVNVSIELDSVGDEVATSFSLVYDANKLRSPVITLGSGVPAETVLTVNPNQIANGRLGVLIDSTNAFAASSPSRQVIVVRFDVAASAPSGATEISFGGSPTVQSTSNYEAALLPTNYESGTVTIGGAAAPRVTVSGRVVTPQGQGLRNAAVSMVDPATGARRSVVTSSFGFFTFTDVEQSRYVFQVTSKRYRFSSRTLTVTDNVTDLNFSGIE
jgi:hypothetical protein